MGNLQIFRGTIDTDGHFRETWWLHPSQDFWQDNNRGVWCTYFPTISVKLRITNQLNGNTHTVTLHDIICKTAFPRYADKIICHLCQHVYGYSVFTCNSILKLGTSPGKSLRHVQSRTISRHQAGMQALLYENAGCVIRQRFVHFYFLSKGSNCRIIG